MGYLIDTNIAIRACEGFEPVLARLAEHEGEVLLSALSLAEMQRGLYVRPEFAAARKERLRILLEVVPVVPFDAVAAEIYGDILAQIGRVKSRDFDRLIAAHALATRSVLVTANIADFRDVPGLVLENWAIGP